MEPIKTKLITCKAGPVHETVSGQGLVELTRVHLELRVENKDAAIFAALEAGENYRISIEQLAGETKA
jgi:hypothetical protein